MCTRGVYRIECSTQSQTQQRHNNRQKGAQYDGKLQYLESLEAQARAQRKGIWSKGPNAELPSQYKARVTKEKAEQFLAPTGG